MTESIRRILVSRALHGHHPRYPEEIIEWLEAAARGWKRFSTLISGSSIRASRRRFDCSRTRYCTMLKNEDPQDIDTLKKRHRELDRKKTTAEANQRSAEDSLAGRGIVADGVVGVDVVFCLGVTVCRCFPAQQSLQAASLRLDFRE